MGKVSRKQHKKVRASFVVIALFLPMPAIWPPTALSFCRTHDLIPKQLKRSLGSGFELVELSQLHGDYCPPIVLQLGGVVVDPFHTSLPSSSKNSLFPGGTATVTSSRESVGSASIVLVEEEELPPEEHWRDGLLSGFFFGGSFCSIGASLAVAYAIHTSPSQY